VHRLRGDFVAELQRDLRTVGILLAPATGDFDLETERAVRELQIYARMPFVAREAAPAARYVDGLTQLPNPQLYTGPISGVANTNTRNALQQWVAGQLRCPVVIEAWTPAGWRAKVAGRNPRNVGLRSPNVWRDVGLGGARLVAHDFTQHYAGRALRDIEIGHVAAPARARGFRGGPLSDLEFGTQAEMVPDIVWGTPLQSLSAAELSTFKVVRAVAEVENFAMFDSVNGFDRAVISLGPQQWTLAAGQELGGFLAFLRHNDRPAFNQAIADFGASVCKDWSSVLGANGCNYANLSLSTFTGSLSLQREDGHFVSLRAAGENAELFRRLHWFYRFVMAGRSIPSFQMHMWPMACLRVRGILETPTGIANLQNSNGDPTMIGDVFTSELAVAFLLRWHVNRPADIVSNAEAGPVVRRAIARARRTVGGAPDRWGNPEEQQLIASLQQELAVAANAGEVQRTMPRVLNWPNGWSALQRARYRLPQQIGALSASRRSFSLEEGQLPPRANILSCLFRSTRCALTQG
jgi:hypothetical protein